MSGLYLAQYRSNRGYFIYVLNNKAMDEIEKNKQEIDKLILQYELLENSQSKLLKRRQETNKTLSEIQQDVKENQSIIKLIGIIISVLLSIIVWLIIVVLF
jgi:DNA polymerase elongation subunit (family B)